MENSLENVWKCQTLEELVSFEKLIYLKIDDMEPEEAQDLIFLVNAAKLAIAGKIDSIAILSKSLDSSMDELKKAYERQKFRIERSGTKIKQIVEQAILIRGIGNKIEGDIYSATRVPSHSCIVENPAIVPDNLKNVEVTIKAVFPATDLDELKYWQEIAAQQIDSKWVDIQIKHVPLKNEIKSLLKQDSGVVPGCSLETNYHVRFNSASTVKRSKRNE